MAVISSFPNNADEYQGAEDVMRWLHGRTKGVYPGDGNAAVTTVQSSMSVNVAPGIGWITDANGDGVCWWFRDAITLTIDDAESTGTLDRIDRIIVEWKTTDYADKPEVKVLKGTSSSSATAPALTNNSTIRQLSLARVNIPAGTTSLTALNIIDERLDPYVCGLVTETVTADTSMIASQYAEAIQTLYDAISQAWSGVISDGAISTAKLADGAVTSIKLANGAVTEEKLAGGHPRRNLLDNWYFPKPVNQRGQSSYSNADAYTIDRWKLTSGSVAVVSGGITLNGTLVQVLANAIGQTVVCSALLSDGTMITPTYDDSTKTFTLTATGQTIVAAKLELGSEQTLAHQENGAWVLNEIPNYAEELATCQRYLCKYTKYDIFVTYPNGGTDFGVFLPCVMRAKPTIINPQNIANSQNTTVAWYGYSSNYLRLRSSTALSSSPECVGDVFFSAEL